MNESFLHYIWKFKRFPTNELSTTEGEPLQILSTGIHNFDAGPDFLNGKVKIGDTVWAGNIEIHINASDWEKHNHSSDPAYDNVILHVVFNGDTDIRRKDSTIIPMLELAGIIDLNLYDKYEQIITSRDWIPCNKHLSFLDNFILNAWLERLLIERLEQKTSIFRNFLTLNKNNWEETFYQLLARHFGMKVNSLPFELLAKGLPSTILAKHKNNLHQLEALLFGQAGLLDQIFVDEYPKRLQKEYDFLRKKYDLQPLQGHLWKLLRLRPANFPTIRIAQFAALVHHSSHLFSKIIEAKEIDTLKKFFDINVSDYWSDHYIFDKPSSSISKKVGNAFIDNIIINVVVPILFFYGKEKQQDEFIHRAFNFLSALPAENNSIIKNWKASGIEVKTSYQSQALIQLYNNYCTGKKCLHCNIGNYILKK